MVKHQRRAVGVKWPGAEEFSHLVHISGGASEIELSLCLIPLLIMLFLVLPANEQWCKSSPRHFCVMKTIGLGLWVKADAAEPLALENVCLRIGKTRCEESEGF